MRRAITTVAVGIFALIGASALAACSSPQTISGCVLQPGTNCSDTDLTEAQLSGIDLSGSTLTNVDFAGADLSGANFEGSNLSKSSFYKANLAGANFVNTNLDDVSFSDAQLDGANFTGSKSAFIESGKVDGSVTCSNGKEWESGSTDTICTDHDLTATVANGQLTEVEMQITTFKEFDPNSGAAGICEPTGQLANVLTYGYRLSNLTTNLDVGAANTYVNWGVQTAESGPLAGQKVCSTDLYFKTGSPGTKWSQFPDVTLTSQQKGTSSRGVNRLAEISNPSVSPTIVTQQGATATFAVTKL